MLQISIINHSNNSLPSAATIGSAGLDISAFLTESVTISPFQRLLIPTGLSIAIPFGYEGQIRPRSGLALHHGITVLNSPGTIDSDYRGEIQVILINFGPIDFSIHNGMRIAQLVISPIAPPIQWEITATLQSSERGAQGFGSTGI